MLEEAVTSEEAMAEISRMAKQIETMFTGETIALVMGAAALFIAAQIGEPENADDALLKDELRALVVAIVRHAPKDLEATERGVVS